jgi:hypothetical protein
MLLKTYFSNKSKTLTSQASLHRVALTAPVLVCCWRVGNFVPKQPQSERTVTHSPWKPPRDRRMWSSRRSAQNLASVR